MKGKLKKKGKNFNSYEEWKKFFNLPESKCPHCGLTREECDKMHRKFYESQTSYTLF